MVNHNGTLLADGSYFLDHTNRGFRYGDALHETMRALHGRLVFWEDHYLRLMSSMRVVRMEIPMNFTMEFLEEEINKVLTANKLIDKPAVIRLTVFRKHGKHLLPADREVSWTIEATALENPFYVMEDAACEIELFRDFYLNDGLLATLHTNNTILQVVGSVYSSENGYTSCLLLNHRKMVAQALDGNVFLVTGRELKTPPLTDGCQNGIVRKKVLEIIGKLQEYDVEESSISPFELQKADELFITNCLEGIRPVTKYRKASYKSEVAKDLLGKLNALARLT